MVLIYLNGIRVLSVAQLSSAWATGSKSATGGKCIGVGRLAPYRFQASHLVESPADTLTTLWCTCDGDG